MNKGFSNSYKIVWEGIHITIFHKPDYVFVYDHIEVMAETPIPITETGYRSIFIQAEEIKDYGGIVELITFLLDTEAQSSNWKEYINMNRQGCLFR